MSEQFAQYPSLAEKAVFAWDYQGTVRTPAIAIAVESAAAAQ